VLRQAGHQAYDPRLIRILERIIRTTPPAAALPASPAAVASEPTAAAG
jgi:hypothetical protein